MIIIEGYPLTKSNQKHAMWWSNPLDLIPKSLVSKVETRRLNSSRVPHPSCLWLGAEGRIPGETFERDQWELMLGWIYDDLWWFMMIYGCEYVQISYQWAFDPQNTWIFVGLKDLERSSLPCRAEASICRYQVPSSVFRPLFHPFLGSRLTR